jgi:hypothetical protein
MWREIVFGVTYVLSVQYSCVAGKLILYKFSCWIRIFFSYIGVSQKYQDFLQLYSRNCFAKILRTFYSSRKSWIIVWRNICNSQVYPRKLCIFEKTIVCESVEFSGKQSFTLYPSLDPYRPTEFVWRTLVCFVTIPK